MIYLFSFRSVCICNEYIYWIGFHIFFFCFDRTLKIDFRISNKIFNGVITRFLKIFLCESFLQFSVQMNSVAFQNNKSSLTTRNTHIAF